jgi:hypothetical protein
MQAKLGRVLLAAAITISAFAPAASAAAQNRQKSVSASGQSSLDVALTYGATLSDIITGSRFNLQGGSVQIHGRFYGGWGVVADIAGAHTANINSTGVGLDLVTATFGPRYTWAPRHARYTLYAQGLVGDVFGINSSFPNPAGANTVADSLAVKAGGGMNLNLIPHFALRLFEADYLRTQLPNSTNNVQNNVTLGAGIVFR